MSLIFFSSVVTAVSARSPNKERKEALASLLFFTEKRDDTIKARLVGDGSKQRTYDGYDKSKGSSPTCATDSIFLTGVIDARERRAVAMLDIENAFLHAENDEKVLVLLRGRLAELMVKVDPSLYRKYVATSEKGVTMLYVKLTKALYGLLCSALLFYKKLRGDLEGLGFKVNPYNRCVANKDINGKQLTVVWYVNDLKVSHKDDPQTE